MYERLKRFLRELFFGTESRAFVTIMVGGVWVVVATYVTSTAVIYYLFDMSYREAVILVTDLSFVLIVLYIIYVVGKVAVRAWRESREEEHES